METNPNARPSQASNQSEGRSRTPSQDLSPDQNQDPSPSQSPSPNPSPRPSQSQTPNPNPNPDPSQSPSPSPRPSQSSNPSPSQSPNPSQTPNPNPNPNQTPSVIVFGAGGRAGRAAVAEARRRAVPVTAVVRDPAKHADLAAPGVTLLAGDVTDPSRVADLAAGHTAAVSAVYDPATAPGEFFAAAATALTAGLAAAGVARLVAVGIGTVLEVAPGVPLYAGDGLPDGAREFSAGHAAELPVLAASGLDWVVLAPPPVVLGEGAGTGTYRLGDTRLLAGADGFTYADLAVALVDEAVAPTRSRELVAVGGPVDIKA